jgi:hypothetical protein
MIYLYGYLGIGVLVLSGLLLKARFNPQKEDLSFYGSRRMSWSLSDVMLFALGVLIWPFFVYLVSQNAPEYGSSEEQKFAVIHEDLLSEMSISEIEQQEKVFDPLGAVPDLPFGHLNAAWEKFLKQVQPTDRLWSFSTQWSQWGSSELRQGYVVVRGEEIGPYFLTLRKYLETRDFAAVLDKLNEDIPAFLRKQGD